MTDPNFNRQLQDKLSTILVRHIEPIFKPGTHFTLIARTPGNNDADVLVTSDSVDEIAALVERSKTRAPV